MILKQSARQSQRNLKMKLDHFLIASGWTKDRVAIELQIPVETVNLWDEIPDRLLPVFQRLLFDLDADQ